MTARMSLFARAYHAAHAPVKVFDDTLARALLGEADEAQIAGYLTQGIRFFLPDFSGRPEEAVALAVTRQLAPSTLGRAAFAEDALKAAVRCGARQYVILGAGYDSFAYRQPEWASGLTILEADLPQTAQEKQQRLAAAHITPPDNLRYVALDLGDPRWGDTFPFGTAVSFCSLLGVAYYLSREVFVRMLETLSAHLPANSSLVFDYPDRSSSDQTARQQQLAAGAGEEMAAGYSFAEMEQLLSDAGFLAYEHLTPPEITERFFADYNRAEPSLPMCAFSGVNYCLAVKKETHRA
jgi:methyltransferase (TIGR00027 family)